MSNPYRSPHHPGPAESDTDDQPRDDSAVTIILIVLMGCVVFGLLAAILVLA